METPPQAAPRTVPLDEAPAPTGPAGAVVLAAAIGALTLGILTTLAEASTGIADGLQWNDRVGPLSGKTLIAVIAFLVSWAGLAAMWRRASPPLRPILIAAAVLLGLGILGTFPTFFQVFAD